MNKECDFVIISYISEPIWMTNPFLVSVTEVSLFISLSKLSFCDVNITLLLVKYKIPEYVVLCVSLIAWLPPPPVW